MKSNLQPACRAAAQFNWTLQVAPDASHQVIIDSTDANGVLLDTTADVMSLKLGGTGTAILDITKG